MFIFREAYFLLLRRRGQQARHDLSTHQTILFVLIIYES